MAWLCCVQVWYDVLIISVVSHGFEAGLGKCLCTKPASSYMYVFFPARDRVIIVDANNGTTAHTQQNTR